MASGADQSANGNGTRSRESATLVVIENAEALRVRVLPSAAIAAPELTDPNPCEEQRQTDDEPLYDVQDMDTDEGRRHLPLVRRQQVRPMGQSAGSGSRTQTP